MRVVNLAGHIYGAIQLKYTIMTFCGPVELKVRDGRSQENALQTTFRKISAGLSICSQEAVPRNSYRFGADASSGRKKWESDS